MPRGKWRGGQPAGRLAKPERETEREEQQGKRGTEERGDREEKWEEEGKGGGDEAISFPR